MSLGAGHDGAFLGHKFSSLQAVVYPLQFSSTKELEGRLFKIKFQKFTHLLAVEAFQNEEGVGVRRMQGQMLCIHAFVQNFLIEYKTDDGLYEVPLFVGSSLVRIG